MNLANYTFSSNVTGIFIDDTGSPGYETNSKHLHLNRKTWVAVLLSPRKFKEVADQMPGAIDEIKKRFGVKEFHFTEILYGKKKYKGIDLSERLGIFNFMSYIFSIYKFPLVCQTFNPEQIEEYGVFSKIQNILPGFDLSNPSHAAFWFLIMRTKKYLQDNKYDLSEKAVVFVDEGLKRAGYVYDVPGLSKDFVDGKIYFDSSEKVFPIQLADYAAFCLNKSQMIMTKEKKTDLDIALMEIISNAKFNFLNLPKIEIDINNYNANDFDEFHRKDRTEKGLNPDIKEA